MENEVFVISNVHRSGSSMMMRCLEAGGMDVAFSDSHEYLNDIYRSEEYLPNGNGFYAPPDDIYSENIAEKYNGRVFKFPFRMLLNIPDTGKYNVLFLKRDPDEIRASMARFMPYESWGMDAVVLELYDEVVDSIIDIVSKKSNVKLTVLNYSDVVKNPKVEFQKLLDNGWNFDTEKAADAVDESLYRFRLER